MQPITIPMPFILPTVSNVVGCLGPCVSITVLAQPDSAVKNNTRMITIINFLELKNSIVIFKLWSLTVIYVVLYFTVLMYHRHMTGYFVLIDAFFDPVS